MRKTSFHSLFWLALFAPIVALAATADNTITIIEIIINVILFFLLIVAGIVFAWGIITYIAAGGSEEKVREGKKYMLWGIIALVVMVAMWGIVRIIIATFDLGLFGIPIGAGEDIPAPQ